MDSAARSSRWRTLPAALRRYLAFLKDAGHSRTRRLLAFLGGLAGLGLAGLVALLLYAAVLYPFTPGRARLERDRVQRPSVVLDVRGEEIARFQRQAREWVSLDQVAPAVVEALVATEDHRFYEHSGVDWRRVASSMGHTLLGDPQGASTLPMQLARNLYPDEVGNAWLPNRKLKEILTAYKIEAVYTKDEILEAYLNTVPFLYNVRGIEMAARTYFSKSARDLTRVEAATLVGMLKATSYYNPRRHPERAQVRRNVVLAQMAKHGALDPAEVGRLQNEPVRVQFQRQAVARSTAPHFTAYVRRSLADWLDDEGLDLYTAGLTIRTSLDGRLQRLAQRAVDRQMPTLQAVADVEWSARDNPLRGAHPGAYVAAQRRTTPFAHFWASKPALVDAFVRETLRYRRLVAEGASAEEALAALRADAAFMDSLRTAKTRLETGFVALDPHTGQIRAWVGSRDYVQAPYDHVATARRQPGSTFKPLVYAAALERGLEPDDTFDDAPVAIPVRSGEVWQPANAGSYTHAAMTVREGLARSKNSIAAQVMATVGPRRAARTARQMGVRASELDRVPSLVLGTSPVTLLEMASAYGTIASGGTYRAPVAVLRVDGPDGTVLWEGVPDEEQAISEETALAVYDMLRDGVAYGTSQRVRSVFGVRADVAGKTGTTQGGVDGWHLLMHPDLVAGAWVGFDDPRVAFRSDYWGQGAHTALYVTGDFFRAALRKGRLNPNVRLPEPAPPHQPWRFAQVVERSGSWLAGLAEQAAEGVRDAWGGLRGQDARAPEPPEPPSPPRAEERRMRDPEHRGHEHRRDRDRARAERRRGWAESDAERQERLERTVRDVLRNKRWRRDLERAIEDYMEAYDGDVAAMLRDADRLERDVERELRRLERELERMEREQRAGW